jgi:hypothetical protein
MTNSIRSYKDLLEEKERLKNLLQVQRQQLRQDVDEIKEELAPVKKVISVAGKFATRDYSNWFLTMASDTAIDLVLRRFLFRNGGFITKFVVPFLAKNFSSHIVSDKKNKIIKKIFSWFGKKNSNGKMHAAAQHDGTGYQFVEDEEED